MKKIITLLFCVAVGLSVHAQTKKVSGSVRDAKTGEELIGVSVLETETTNGIVTDLDGNFTIQVQEGAELQLSYVGYLTTTIKADASDLGIIALKPEAIALEDVTITGQLS